MSAAFRSPLMPLAIVVITYALLIGLMIAAPQNALGFYPGLLSGVIACVAWRTWRMPPTTAQTRRRLRVVGTILGVWFCFALVPQRDIPIAGAPLGLLFSLAGALVLDRRQIQ